MGDSIELQNIGKSLPQNPSRVDTTTVILSLRMIIISVVILAVIVGTILLTSLYIIHNGKLKQVDTQISTLNLAQLVNNLQHEYMEKMHQNISHSHFLDTKTLLQLHNSAKDQIMKIYDETEKLSEEKEAKTVVTYRNQLSEKMDKLFTTISHEQTFRKVVSEELKLTNETEERIKELYDEEFLAAAINYTGRDPPDVSSEFHEHVSDLTLSKAIALKIVPSSPDVLYHLKGILWRTYKKNLEDHAVIGIDFGESYIRSFVYSNGQLKKWDKYETYVGFEEYDGYSELDLKYFVIPHAKNALPIFYDLKEIIRAWNSFNASSDKLFWTFNVQNGTTDGPSVSSPITGIRHTVASVVAKLFHKVKEANGVNHCVITIPYGFTEDQRNLILEASKTAGFEEVTLLDEDISAALTLQYVHGPWNGTKNIMFLEFNQLSWKMNILVGYHSHFTRIVSEEYIKTEDVVHICIEEYCQQFECDKETFKYDGSFDARVRWRQLYEECETAILQFTENGNEELYPLFRSRKWPTKYIYRNTTEKAIEKQIENFTRFIDSILRQQHVNLTKEEIDEVILGGKYGSLRVVNETISRYFIGRNLTIIDVSPVDTIAYGAAVKGLELAAAAINRSLLKRTPVRLF